MCFLKCIYKSVLLAGSLGEATARGTGVSWIRGNAADPLSQAVGTVAASSPLHAKQASPPGARPFRTGLAHYTVTQSPWHSCRVAAEQQQRKSFFVVFLTLREVLEVRVSCSVRLT